MHYVRRTNIMDIYIEPARKAIVIRQRWKYNWLSEPPLDFWTYEERRKWHHKADDIIWSNWSNKFSVYSFTHSGKFKELDGVTFKVEFDIEWVLDNPHWTVNVHKTLPFRNFNSNVNWSNQNINLSSIDLDDVVRDNVYSQITFNHEFGHTFLNDEEYGPEWGNPKISPYRDDKRALMNIGNELRDRYFILIEEQLNKWFKEVEFLIELK